MKALKNLCKTQNICLICTLHQTSSEVLSMINFIYVLAKGGHNVFWGPTIELRQYLEDYGIMSSDANRVPIETLISLSTEGLRDTRLVNMCENTKQVVNDWIELSENNLIIETIDKITKKFCYKDIVILSQREVTEVLQYKYKFYIMDAILCVTSLLLSNVFGTDIGEYDDCFSFEGDIGCQQKELAMNMVEHNTNYMGNILWIISLIRILLTIQDRLIKTRYFYHHHRNS